MWIEDGPQIINTNDVTRFVLTVINGEDVIVAVMRDGEEITLFRGGKDEYGQRIYLGKEWKEFTKALAARMTYLDVYSLWS